MRLADCSSRRYCFELDPHTGVYSRLKLPTPRSERRGYSGIGQLLRSPREGKVLFAEYVLEGEAWFSIGAERWKRFDRARCWIRFPGEQRRFSNSAPDSSGIRLKPPGC